MSNALQGQREKIKPNFIHQGQEQSGVGGSSDPHRSLTSKAVEIPRKGQNTTEPRHGANTPNS